MTRRAGGGGCGIAPSKTPGRLNPWPTHPPSGTNRRRRSRGCDRAGGDGNPLRSYSPARYKPLPVLETTASCLDASRLGMLSGKERAEWGK